MTNVDPSLYPPLAPEVLPNLDERYSITSSSTVSLHIQTESLSLGMGLSEFEGMQRSLPLTRELYGFTCQNGGRVDLDLPTPYALNAFNERHLRGLGSTTMQVRQVGGGKFTAEELAGYYAEGIIPLATETKYYFHDISDHMLGAITLAEEPTKVFQTVAGLHKPLTETDPKAARELAVSLAAAFDRQTSVSARFLKAVPDYDEGPLLLTGLLANLKDDDGLMGLIEDIIEEPPTSDTTDSVVGTKLERWAEWEAENMPAYGQKLVEELSKSPRSASRSRVARVLSRLFAVS
jgi:hypothetical protein